ncbi:ATP synthase F0 subcomplex B' subunit [Thalassoporum mexicanum PCC 7367]|uniref:F0F1 ATP synthase subunit B' n=1 Tax=Thalassoporum mexicanum TaxID=3457544 RepID=UPI0002A0002C|nr:F0F1 ATP synthase subunit B' [Pseudanabaena sp. PCC 7367]AFY70563.1 ATP synthase F0 subcomplex B' subunit [Pseudanabaena sp. PCC 7367]
MTHWIFLVATESAEKGGLFDLNATLPVIAAQFLILVAILNQTFFKPLTKSIDDRGAYVRDNVNEAKQRLEKAEELAIAYEQELATARKQTQEIIASAQAEANKIRSEQISAAVAEAQTKASAARAELDQQKQEAAALLDNEVNALSRQILEKLLGDLVNS